MDISEEGGDGIGAEECSSGPKNSEDKSDDDSDDDSDASSSSNSSGASSGASNPGASLASKVIARLDKTPTGDVAHGGEIHHSPRPYMAIKNFGRLRFPLAEEQVKTLCDHAKNLRTRTHGAGWMAVRPMERMWQVPGDHIWFGDDKRWEDFVRKVLDRAARYLGFPPHKRAEFGPRLCSLNIWTPDQIWRNYSRYDTISCV